MSARTGKGNRKNQVVATKSADSGTKENISEGIVHLGVVGK
jgi:hypothetical protein